MNIAKTNDLTLLIKKGKTNIEDCLIAWERIVQSTCKATRTFEYDTKFNNLAQYNKLLYDFILVKGSLLRLCLKYNKEDVAFLKGKNYKIDTSSNEAYADSLQLMLRRSDNIITKLNSKKNEIAASNQEGDTRPVEFEELIAGISAELGFEVSTEVTLARYNEYRKIVGRKQKSNERDNQR
jgi:hypothetical protein